MTIGDVAALGWMAATLGLVAMAIRDAMVLPGRGPRRVLVLLAAGAVWAVIQVAAMLVSVFTTYCESCEGRPTREEEWIAALVLCAPTAIAWVAFLVWRLRVRRHAAMAARARSV